MIRGSAVISVFTIIIFFWDLGTLPPNNIVCTHKLIILVEYGNNCLYATPGTYAPMTWNPKDKHVHTLSTHIMNMILSKEMQPMYVHLEKFKAQLLLSQQLLV